MKELSIREKAKAYDEAMERAKAYQGLRSEMEIIFPELKDEDERIRKDIIYHIQNCDDTIDEVTEKRMLAWLERQGEHANFRNKIQIGDKVTRNEDGVLVNLSQLKRIAKPAENKGKHNMGISEATKQELEDNLNKALEKETPESCNEFLEKQGEQKPAEWSEEDERVLCKCLGALGNLNYCYEDGDLERMRNWLKSLRPQSQWKPSDAQIASITCAVRKMKESACYDSELVSLLNDLKKLK